MEYYWNERDARGRTRYSYVKARLTRAQRQLDKARQAYIERRSDAAAAQAQDVAAHVLAITAEVFGSFTEHGYPDDWHRVQRLEEDAQYLRRATARW